MYNVVINGLKNKMVEQSSVNDLIKRRGGINLLLYYLQSTPFIRDLGGGGGGTITRRGHKTLTSAGPG